MGLPSEATLTSWGSYLATGPRQTSVIGMG
jgi:hypothetical protein